MAIEVLQDILTELADKIGVYGAHDDEDDEACEKKPCRCCWESAMRSRIEAAIEIERMLGQVSQ